MKYRVGVRITLVTNISCYLNNCFPLKDTFTQTESKTFYAFISSYLATEEKKTEETRYSNFNPFFISLKSNNSLSVSHHILSIVTKGKKIVRKK